jgi:hypothetical protein
MLRCVADCKCGTRLYFTSEEEVGDAVFRPAMFDAAPEAALADGIAVGAQRFHRLGITIRDCGERWS